MTAFCVAVWLIAAFCVIEYSPRAVAVALPDANAALVSTRAVADNASLVASSLACRVDVACWLAVATAAAVLVASMTTSPASCGEMMRGG